MLPSATVPSLRRPASSLLQKGSDPGPTNKVLSGHRIWTTLATHNHAQVMGRLMGMDLEAEVAAFLEQERVRERLHTERQVLRMALINLDGETPSARRRL